jgi:hypothetical protein
MPQHRWQDRSSKGKAFDFLDDDFNDSSNEDVDVGTNMDTSGYIWICNYGYRYNYIWINCGYPYLKNEIAFG